MGVHEINDQRRAERVDLPRLVPGAVMWHLPVRWWEPDDYPPRRVQVVGPNGPLVWSEEYGHTVYVQHADLFNTPAQCAAEMRARTALDEAEFEAMVARAVAQILAREY